MPPVAASSKTITGPALKSYESRYVAIFAACASMVAFSYFFRHGEILLMGDATAHIHIARRVFDSRTPGFSQLGTVWLPLPHILLLPFIFSNWAWQTGIGGSIPSMLSYVAGTVGIFRLVRGMLPLQPASRAAAWCAAIAFAGNPNLLYLQATAMTEPLYLALFVWAMVYFSEFVQATRSSEGAARLHRVRALRRCGWMLCAAMLTRYDAWFAALAFTVAGLAVLWNWTGRRIALWRSPLSPLFVQFVLIITLAPAFWLAYNAINWGNPLEFANGPYSARAIEARAHRPDDWHYPGWHAPTTAAFFFLKAAKLDMAGVAKPGPVADFPARSVRWGGHFENAWLGMAVLGTILVLVWGRVYWPILLLWLPLPVYVLSISWGSVPIFVPVWWPYSYYNVRYGLQMLPAFAVMGAIVVYFVSSRGNEGSHLARKRMLAAAGTSLLFLIFVGGGYFLTWQATPSCVQEAQLNNAARVLFDQEVSRQLTRLPQTSRVLMYTASHAAALEFAGFPLRRTINESDKKLWSAALAAPSLAADFVVAFENADDPVWRSAQQHQDDLQVIAIVNSPGQARAFFYQRRQ